MMRRTFGFACACVAAAIISAGCGSAGGRAGGSARYDDLVALFADWRAFHRPVLVNNVPDYTGAAMAAQHRDLAPFRRRLAELDTRGWPVGQQIDWHLVRAEMNGLDFDHRVLRPWANNPAFYVTVFPSQSDQPAREGPLAHGAVELWSHEFPLSADSAAVIERGVRTIPALLRQAKGNLVGNGRDLWRFGIGSIREQAADLEQFAARLGGEHADLKTHVLEATRATGEFAAWLEAEAPRKTGPSGIGIDHYDWYLRNVHLVPYTWREQLTRLERELGRARTFLALEEQRNRDQPQQEPIAGADEHAARFPAAVAEYMAFLRDHDILTVRDFMEPALLARVGRFRPGPREFFTEVDYRDPVVMRTHGYHWFDLARMAAEPHPSPIRRVPLLYNLFDSRTEGLATGWEEMMLQAGMFDARPRSRELIYILVAQRAARAIGDLKMHANAFTLEEAAAFASANTPRGWLRLDGSLVRGEQHLYLQQPSYGTSYLIGKMQIEELMGVRRRQLGDTFTLRRFMDELDACGLIPMSLIAWELTGEQPAFLARAGAGAR
ncbi:MAG: DUF885 family protein [Vicinamibacterales bacterium]